MSDSLIVPWGLLHKLENEEKIIVDDYNPENIPDDYKYKDKGYYFYNTYGQTVQWTTDTMNTLIPDKAKELISNGEFYIALTSFESDIPRYDYVSYDHSIARVNAIDVDSISITKTHVNVDLWRDINGIASDDQIRAFRSFYDTQIPSGERVKMMRIFLGYISYISPKSYIRGINRYRYI